MESPAAAFAVVGLGEGTLGLFQISDRKLRVVECMVELDDYRFVRSPAYLLHKKHARLLSIAGLNSDRLFFQWQPDILIQVGDKVAFIECVENDFASVNHQLELPNQSNQSHSLALQNIEKLLQKITSSSFWKSKWNQIVFWFQAQRSRRLILWGILTAIVLWGISSMILFFNVPNISWQKSISASMILLLGGFGDVFGGLGEDQVPLWVVIFCLSITLISLLFLLGVVGLIADSILSLNFLRKLFLYPTAIILSLSVLADLGNGLPTYYSSFSIKSLLLVHILISNSHYESKLVKPLM